MPGVSADTESGFPKGPSVERARLRAVASGRVQGVNFRYYTVQEATRLRLVGWVKNRRDGSVEVVAEGPRETLERLLEFLRTGPPAARVTGVQVTWNAPTGEFSDFDIRYF